MRVFKGICTDFVSDIDKLFHAPDRNLSKSATAKQIEIKKADRIARLRDRVEQVECHVPTLWEGF